MIQIPQNGYLLRWGIRDWVISAEWSFKEWGFGVAFTTFYVPHFEVNLFCMKFHLMKKKA